MTNMQDINDTGLDIEGVVGCGSWAVLDWGKGAIINIYIYNFR